MLSNFASGEIGNLIRLDLRTRQWAPPLRVETETYIWNLCRSSDGMVYGGTYPGCVLLRYDPKRHTLHFATWDPAGRIAWSHAFEPPNTLGGVWTVHGRVLVRVGAELQVFDPRALAFTGTIATGGTVAACLPLADGQMLAFCQGGGTWRIDLHALTSQAQDPLPGDVKSAARGPNGTIYAAVGSHLYAITA